LLKKPKNRISKSVAKWSNMKQYIGMIEVLGEGGELQPLFWNPNHLVDGRAILIVNEAEGQIWIWLGRGITMIQRTTALRQARFIMRNGIHIGDLGFGTKCTEFIEVPGDLNASKAGPLKTLLEEHPKEDKYLLVVEQEPEISTFDDEFQSKVDAIEHTISPEPVRQPVQTRRRMLSYEEQLASKVVFAVSDCYGQATLTPLGPNLFEVAVLRLQLRFYCHGESILFTLVRAASQDDIDGFIRCYGQQPQLSADGQQYIDSALAEAAKDSPTAKPISDLSDSSMSVFDRMRKQLSEIKPKLEAVEKEASDKPETEDEEDSQDSGSTGLFP
jgi:hypothetical protein